MRRISIFTTIMKSCLLLLLFLISQNSNSQNSIKQENGIPDWVKKIYEIDNEEFLNDAIPSVIFFNQLSDSTSYCLFEVSDGVCLITFVATQKNKKHFKKFKIGNECDADFSKPEYSWADYEHDTTRQIIKSTNHIEKAKSKFLINESNGIRFKEGYDLETAETIKYSIISIITIRRTGNIIVRNK